MRKVSLKNYENAEYKETLSAEEYNIIVSSSVSAIKSFYDNGMFGFNTYIIQKVLIQVCTNIKFPESQVNKEADFINSSGVINKIINSIGENAYNNIIHDIDLGVRYVISTNPEMKELLRNINSLIVSLENNSSFVNEESFKTITETLKGALGDINNNENQ